MDNQLQHNNQTTEAVEIPHQERTISGLYYRYKRTSDEEIVRLLDRMPMVKHIDGRYFPLKSSVLDKIKAKPRGYSPSYDSENTDSEPLSGLVPVKTLTFLVKSSSRFFLKPDVGEVYDQILWEDQVDKNIVAFSIHQGHHETLPETDGEHFLMTAVLYKRSK